VGFAGAFLVGMVIAKKVKPLSHSATVSISFFR